MFNPIYSACARQSLSMNIYVYCEFHVRRTEKTLHTIDNERLTEPIEPQSECVIFYFYY